MTDERKQEIRNLPWHRMVCVIAPMTAHGMEGYNERDEYLYKKYINDKGEEIYVVTNHDIKDVLEPGNMPSGDITNLGRTTFFRYFKPLIEKQKMEENKNTQSTGQAERMKQLVKSFDEKAEVIRESEDKKVDETKVLAEAGRLKTIARIDEYLNNQQFVGTVNFNPGYGQTVNTFLPSSSNSTTTNQKYNPNYTYLQPAEALGLSIKRALESGAPVKDMGFYEEVNWNLNNMGFESKLPLDIKNALVKMLKDNG